MKAMIIGSGAIGQRHARNLAAIDQDVDFIYLRRSSDHPTDLPRGEVVTSLEAALESGVTFAVLATPTALHADMLEPLIASGIPTYVEKPVVATRKQHSAISEALLTGPAAAHVAGFNFRLLRSLKTAKDLIARGRLGLVARATFSAGQWLPDWRPSQDYRQSYSARTSSGGGVILDLCHEIDLARWLLGELEIKACETTRNDKLGIDAAACAQIIGKTEAGALVSIGLDYVARQKVRHYEFVGDEATLVWDLPTQEMKLISKDSVEIVTSAPADFDVSSTYVDAMRVFARQAQNALGQHDLQSLDDGLISTQLAITACELGS